MKKLKKIGASIVTFFLAMGTKAWGAEWPYLQPAYAAPDPPNHYEGIIKLLNIESYIAVPLIILNGIIIMYKKKKKQKIGTGLWLILLLELLIILGVVIVNIISKIK